MQRSISASPRGWSRSTLVALQGALGVLLGAVGGMSTHVPDAHAVGLDCSSTSPIHVDAAEDLADIATDPACLDKHFVQSADIDLAAVTYTPIGSFGAPFTGTYDGGGFQISNLTIGQPGADNLGLFGVVNGATLTEIQLANVNVTGGNWVGGLVGWMIWGTISNVSVSGSVTGMGSDGYVGGIAGQTGGDLDRVTSVVDSYAQVTVSGIGHVGGLIGADFLANRSFSTGTIAGSYAIGQVTATGYANGYSAAGGLIGYADAAITDSFATGDVTGKNFVGGLVGHQFGAINRSYAVGDAQGVDHVGGLVGQSGASISNSYASGSESATGSNVDDLVGSSTGAASLTNSDASVPSALTTFQDAGWAIKQGTAPESGKVWGFCVGEKPFLLWDQANVPSPCNSPGADGGNSPGDSPPPPPPSGSGTTSPDEPAGVETIESPAPGTQPSLVSATDAPALQQPAGQGGATVNGVPTAVEIVTVDAQLADVPAEQRTPEQVAALQESGRQLVDAFNSSAPGGTSPLVTVTNTDTGAVVNGVAVDPDDGETDVPVPVEDVVLLSTTETKVLFAAVTDGGEPEEVTDGVLELSRNGGVSILAYGLPEGETGELVLFSTPTLLARFTANADGSLAAQMRVPAGVEAGAHTLVLAAGGVTASLGLLVDADGNASIVDPDTAGTDTPTTPNTPTVPSAPSGRLPNTGDGTTALVLMLGIWSMLIGVVLISRRRAVLD